jgi:predicted Na+-dependent transporter
MEEHMTVSPCCVCTFEDHSWLAALTLGTIFLSLWSSLSLCQYDAFAQKEPPHSLIVLCQLGVLPVIVSQHSTA